MSCTLLTRPKSNKEGTWILLPTLNTTKTEAPIPVLELANKAIVSKIAKGTNILKNKGTLGLRNKLAL